MKPGLSDKDEEVFEELRAKLEGVKQADTESSRPIEFGPIDPMLAESFDGDLTELSGEEWIGEPKYDGTRLLVEHVEGSVGVFTRRGIERSEAIGSVFESVKNIPEGTILDGEFVYLREDGISEFIPIHGGDEKIDEQNLTPRLFIFDILVHDSEWVTERSLMERKSLIEDVVPAGEDLQPVEYIESGFQSSFDEIVNAGGEGIMVKRRESYYYTNTRSSHWQKVKGFSERDAVVVGYTEGEGVRAETFGALVLTDSAQYIGRVGSGFSEQELTEFREEMTQVEDRPIPASEVGQPYTPVEPFVISVKYQEITDNNELRAPVFLQRNPTKPIDDIEPVDE